MKRKTDNFSKFYNRKSNSAVKEQIKQEKKAIKKERKEAIERHFEEKRKARGVTLESGTQQKKPSADTPSATGELLPLNKYIAHCGVCSRRDAALLVKQGKVTVNDHPVLARG